MPPKVVLCMLALFGLLGSGRAHSAELTLDLPAALDRALRDNPELRVKRHGLGIAQGRREQAGLLFQSNPRFAVETESRFRARAAPVSNSA